MRPMILGFLLLACCLTSVMAAAGDKQSPEPKKKVNFFNADNGLGAVAAADLGLYLGAVAFHENGPWQGFPESAGNGDIAAALSAPSDCAESNGGAIAKALLNNPASPPPPP